MAFRHQYISRFSLTLFLAFTVVSIPTFSGLGIAESSPQVENPSIVTRIAFGSCIKADRPQKFWKEILKKKPEIMVLAGDNIYANSGDPAVLKKHYDMLGSDPDFQKMRNSVKLMATWDDHDMGKNDGGSDFEGKDEARKAHLDFFKVPEDSPRRKHGGVYNAEIFGPEGKQAQIILLDTRYFRSPLVSTDIPGKPPYGPNWDPKATILGSEQWAWLEEELKKPADIRIIVTSIQFLAVDHTREKWSNFPLEREKMIKLIKKTGAQNVMFVSGDRHHGQLYKMNTDELPFPLYEMTTSNLNRSGNSFFKPSEPDRYTLTKTYHDHNFGMIEIDWDTRKTSMTVFKINGRKKYQVSF